MACIVNEADSEVSMEQAVINILQERKMTFTCAESCTGGMFSARMVSVPGASDVYNMGFITYANEAKHKLIGVSLQTLTTYGAVSKECAEEMAYGVAKAAQADIAVSITGIAGPGGGSIEKPVGLVYIGCFYNGNTIVRECRFSGNRQEIRESSVLCAISLMFDCLTNNN